MKTNKSSYSQILKATSMFGGSIAFAIIIGIIRTKVIALILGPIGIGIMGIYQSLVEMIKSISTLGVDTGGIREVAIAESSEDRSALEKMVSAIRFWFLVAGLLGALSCIVLCKQISLWSFENTDYASNIAWLSLCVFITIFALGNGIILQGLRKINYLSQAVIFSSVAGLVITVPLYFWLKMDAIIPGLIINILCFYLFAEYYYRKLNIPKAEITSKEKIFLSLSAIQLGLFIVIAGAINTISMFLIRTYLTRQIGLESAGYFQAAWSISNVYLGLVLKSMGTDFFPRLSTISHEKDKVKKLVDEQSYIVLIISSPLIIGMLVFSDLSLSFLYSSKFILAQRVLDWQLIGSFLKVMTWPISFILLAKHKGFLFFVSEASFYVVYLGSFYLLFPKYGLDATGMAYLIAYALYMPIIVLFSKKVSGYFWNKQIIIMALVNLMIIIAASYICFLQPQLNYSVGIALLLLSLTYSYLKLKKVFSLGDLKSWFGKK